MISLLGHGEYVDGLFYRYFCLPDEEGLPDQLITDLCVDALPDYWIYGHIDVPDAYETYTLYADSRI